MDQTERIDRATASRAALLDGTSPTRNTTLYRIVIQGADWDRVERMILKLPVTLQGANVVNGKGYVQFRAWNDSVALHIAEEATEHTPHQVVVGMGAHTRIVGSTEGDSDYAGTPDVDPQEPPTMLARAKWQIKTLAVLEMVFNERVAQNDKHGDAMSHLPDGVGPDVTWCDPVVDGALGVGPVSAIEVEEIFRENYNGASMVGRLTRMHLVREEIAEAFKEHGDSPEFLAEIIQVAALCVQWAEIKLAEKEADHG